MGQTITGKAVYLPLDNLKTEDILPRTAYAQLSQKDPADLLFERWRYTKGLPKEPLEDFPLNQAQYKEAKILILGENIGKGAEALNTVLALKRYGFRAIIAGSFGDDFEKALVERGILPIRLAKEQRLLLAEAEGLLTIHLDPLMIEAGQTTINYSLLATYQKRFMSGEDQIDRTLNQYGDLIAAYEASKKQD